MKKFFKYFIFLLLIFNITLGCNAMNFSEGLSKSAKKPMILLVYAEWASGYNEHITIMNSLEKEYGNKYNFVKLNIADAETAVFNSKFNIYSNLPYILIFKDGGKVTRYINRDCSIDYSCVLSKIKLYLQ